MAKKEELIGLIEKAKVLEIGKDDINRFERTHEVFKAKFVNKSGVEYYRYYHTLKEFTSGVIMANRFKSKLLAYYRRIGPATKVVIG